jgi:hypothetical protein
LDKCFVVGIDQSVGVEEWKWGSEMKEMEQSPIYSSWNGITIMI